ncbi:CPCC family cysteine-rich protein [Cytobacillus gottheilii]|uniref:CPCC family cysteine-rich protein n=1 Tax=Cytobacillus gottheilii TaxID=859144 RepID=UPI000834EEBD|nr:CPCC family cysteine-rich protein [Cytobacillus gottheilii]
MRFTCPCCGYKTLNEEPPGTFTVCEICYWEDDNIQFEDPDYEGGANVVSLRQGQRNYIKFGASDCSYLRSVRIPNGSDLKDPAWKKR